MEQADVRFYEFMAEVRTRLAVIEQQGAQMLLHAKETNGRVHKLEIAYNALEKDMNERDVHIEALIANSEKKVKVWVLKALLGVSLILLFIELKEGREAILHIIQTIF